MPWTNGTLKARTPLYRRQPVIVLELVLDRAQRHPSLVGYDARMWQSRFDDVLEAEARNQILELAANDAEVINMSRPATSQQRREQLHRNDTHRMEPPVLALRIERIPQLHSHSRRI